MVCIALFLHPTYEIVYVIFGEGGGEVKELEVFDQLRMPTSHDRREWRCRVNDGHSGLDADRERFRSVGAHASLRTELHAELLQVRHGASEFVSALRDRPVPADRGEDSEEMAERAAGRQSRRDLKH